NRCILEGSSERLLSFKHRGMMEFYAGLHLARNTQKDWATRDAGPGGTEALRCGDRRLSEFTTDENWYWAWRFAIEMPAAVWEDAPQVLLASLAELYQPPEQPEEPQVGEGPTRQELQRKEREQAQRVREFTRQRLEAGELEDEEIEIEVEQSQMQSFQLFSPAGMEEMGIDMQDLLGNLMPSQTVTKKTTVAEARSLLTRQEAERLIDPNEVGRKAVERVENDGIVFLDEMDKIAGREGGHGPEVSREGVQRDILPIVEGSTVMTKYGPVSTDHILFIAAGAFHVTKPSDMIPELQGRFPVGSGDALVAGFAHASIRRKPVQQRSKWAIAAGSAAATAFGATLENRELVEELVARIEINPIDAQ
ncbi:MAG: AAA family ATPase, partial [Armatimonadota bacterium]